MSVFDACRELSFKTEFAACIGKQSGSSPLSSTITTLSPIVNTAHTPYNVNIVVKTWWERW